MSGYYAGYALVALVLVAGIGFVAFAYLGNRLLAPSLPDPGDESGKLLAYECGVDPVGEGWAQVHIRYYVFAFLYVVFAVDAIFLFPWATVFAAPGFGATTLIEMFVFLAFLALGVLYAWRTGVLTWD